MSPKVRQGVAFLLFAAVFCLSWPAAAWIETRAKGLLSTVEVEADGRATIGHELVLEVRGGPLKKLELPTADLDAEVLPDATVTRTAGGVALPLLVERGTDGLLTLEIDHERGLRTGTYTFVVRYRTTLSKVVARHGKNVEIAWTGPRLESGVDGVRTIFRLPPGEAAPRLPTVRDDDAEPAFGVLVSAIRRTAAHDEIELVRSHVARGEPVLWRVEAFAGALASAAKAPSAAAEVVTGVAPTPAVSARPPRGSRWSWWALAAGSALALLIWQKERFYVRACAASGSSARALVRVPVGFRAALAGAALGGALYAGAKLEEATLAGILLLVMLACSVLVAPRRPRAPRSPGRWLPLSSEDAFGGSKPVLPGAWLDSGTLRGFVALLVAVAAVVLGAALELQDSPYRALLILCCGSALVPLFFTGRASDLLGDRVAFSRRFLERLERKLRGETAWKTVPWGRVPDGSGVPDELRLLLQPREALDGLVALEVALEPQAGLGGVVGAPFVIVRAREGSRAQSALPNGVIWTRGRKADERVAILSPNLPTLALTVRLIGRLSSLLARKPELGAPRASEGSAPVRKIGRVVSPAHAL